MVIWKGSSTSRDRRSGNHIFCGHRGATRIRAKEGKVYKFRWSHGCWKASPIQAKGSGTGGMRIDSLCFFAWQRSPWVFLRPCLSPRVFKEEETIQSGWSGCGSLTGLPKCSFYLECILWTEEPFESLSNWGSPVWVRAEIKIQSVPVCWCKPQLWHCPSSTKVPDQRSSPGMMWEPSELLPFSRSLYACPSLVLTKSSSNIEILVKL